MGAIIDKLEYESVLSIGVDDGETSVTFYSWESAWDHSESISKAELGQLIQELTEIHGKLKGQTRGITVSRDKAQALAS